jgi:hypothetical protein
LSCRRRRCDLEHKVLHLIADDVSKLESFLREVGYWDYRVIPGRLLMRVVIEVPFYSCELAVKNVIGY